MENNKENVTIKKEIENEIMKVKAKYEQDGYRVIKIIELYSNEIQLYIDYYRNNVGYLIGFSIPVCGYLQYDLIKHDLNKINDIADFEFTFLKLIKMHIYNLEYDMNKNKQK
jgi:hypothetical protein